jgi:hypothetical protein
VAVYDAVRAQLDPPLGSTLRPFTRMRQRRNQAEYPSSTAPAVTATEVRDAQAAVEQIIDSTGGASVTVSNSRICDWERGSSPAT